MDILAAAFYLYNVIFSGIKAIKTPLIKNRAIEGDREREFHVVETMLAGEWKRLGLHDALGTCLFITYLPYLIHRMSGWDIEKVFRIFPIFFQSLMPAFVYLISRQFLDVGYSFMAAAYLLSTFFFVKEPNTGRGGTAWGFTAGGIYFLLSGHPMPASVFMVLMVFTHYATTLNMVFVLGTAAGLLAIMNEYDGLIDILIVLGATGLTMFLLYWVMFPHVGHKLVSQVVHSVSLRSPTLAAPTYKAVADGRIEHWAKAAPDAPPEKGKVHAIFEVEHRDPLLQMALGRTWRYFGLAQKIEFVLGWMTVILMTVGLALSFLWLRHISPMFVALSVAFFCALASSVIIPHVSVYYGIARTHTVSLVMLAPCFSIGIMALFGLIGVNPYVFGLAIILLYALCVSKIFRRVREMIR